MTRGSPSVRWRECYVKVVPEKDVVVEELPMAEDKSMEGERQKQISQTETIIKKKKKKKGENRRGEKSGTITFKIGIWR